jgi:hypothetical protein
MVVVVKDLRAPQKSTLITLDLASYNRLDRRRCPFDPSQESNAKGLGKVKQALISTVVSRTLALWCFSAVLFNKGTIFFSHHKSASVSAAAAAKFQQMGQLFI